MRCSRFKHNTTDSTHRISINRQISQTKKIEESKNDNNMLRSVVKTKQNLPSTFTKHPLFLLYTTYAHFNDSIMNTE